jgi:hypothetical protein
MVGSVPPPTLGPDPLLDEPPLDPVGLPPSSCVVPDPDELALFEGPLLEAPEPLELVEGSPPLDVLPPPYEGFAPPPPLSPALPLEPPPPPPPALEVDAPGTCCPGEGWLVPAAHDT